MIRIPALHTAAAIAGFGEGVALGCNDITEGRAL